MLNLTLVGPVFSEAGSWLRDPAAASVSAGGGAAPARTGLAASWSWTRWTAGNNQSGGFEQSQNGNPDCSGELTFRLSSNTDDSSIGDS